MFRLRYKENKINDGRLIKLHSRKTHQFDDWRELVAPHHDQQRYSNTL
jgi:hypothetical protein